MSVANETNLRVLGLQKMGKLQHNNMIDLCAYFSIITILNKLKHITNCLEYSFYAFRRENSRIFSRVVTTARKTVSHPAVLHGAQIICYFMIDRSIRDRLAAISNSAIRTSDLTAQCRADGNIFADQLNALLFSPDSQVTVLHSGIDGRNAYGQFNNTVLLSSDSYYNGTIPALSTVAHEFGHAYSGSRSNILIQVLYGIPLVLANILTDLASYTLPACMLTISGVFFAYLVLIDKCDDYIDALECMETPKSPIPTQEVRLRIQALEAKEKRLNKIVELMHVSLTRIVPFMLPRLVEEAYASIVGYTKMTECFELSDEEKATSVEYLALAWLAYLNVFVVLALTPLIVRSMARNRAAAWKESHDQLRSEFTAFGTAR